MNKIKTNIWKNNIRTNLISSRVVIEESNCIQCLLESRLTINKPAIESSFKLQMKNDNIVVHINSKDINWEIILIQPNMEYLLLPENADKIMNNIDIPEIIIIKTRESIKLIK